MFDVKFELKSAIDNQNNNKLKDILYTYKIDLDFKLVLWGWCESTILEYAIKHQKYPDEKIITTLIEYGMDINYVNDVSYLQHCLYNEEKKDIAKLLLKSGADPNVGDRYFLSCSPLMFATQKNDLPTMELLLQNHADPNLGKKSHPLNYAAQNGFTEAVKLLLQYNANPFLEDVLEEEKKYNAYELADQKGHVEICTLLQAAMTKFFPQKVDRMIISQSIIQGLWFALEYKELVVIMKVIHVLQKMKTLEKSMTDIKELDIAPPFNVKSIIEENENNALLLASLKGILPCVQALLRLGANPNLHPPKELPPVGLALIQGVGQTSEELKETYLQCVKTLIARGADVNFVDMHGNALICLSIKKMIQTNAIKNLCFIETLLINNANPKPALELVIEQKIQNKELIDLLKKYSPNEESLSKLSFFSEQKPIIKVQIPEVYLCPVTYVIMKNPYLLTLDGYTYDYSFIEKWLTEHRDSPMTRKKMEENEKITDVLSPNRILKEIIEQFIKEHPEIENDEVNEKKCIELK